MGKIQNIATGIVKTIENDPMTEAEQKRLTTCQECTKSPMCPECYCIIKVKIRVEEEKCPKGLW